MAFLTISAVDILISTISYIEQHNRSSLVKKDFVHPTASGWLIGLILFFFIHFFLVSGSDD